MCMRQTVTSSVEMKNAAGATRHEQLGHALLVRVVEVGQLGERFDRAALLARVARPRTASAPTRRWPCAASARRAARALRAPRQSRRRSGRARCRGQSWRRRRRCARTASRAGGAARRIRSSARSRWPARYSASMRSTVERAAQRVVAPGLVAEQRDAACEMAERRFVGGGELGLAPGEEVQLGETRRRSSQGIDERHGEDRDGGRSGRRLAGSCSSGVLAMSARPSARWSSARVNAAASPARWGQLLDDRLADAVVIRPRQARVAGRLIRSSCAARNTPSSCRPDRWNRARGGARDHRDGGWARPASAASSQQRADGASSAQHAPPQHRPAGGAGARPSVIGAEPGVAGQLGEEQRVAGGSASSRASAARRRRRPLPRRASRRSHSERASSRDNPPSSHAVTRTSSGRAPAAPAQLRA